MAKKAWSGVFSQATDRRVEQFTESISFDRRLYAHDIAASIAHAQMLAKVGLITAEECRQIEQGLRAIRQEIEQGKFEFHVELEDIHLHIERALIERIGDVGRKLHTARSRNDQVSTDLRLWCRDAIDRLDEQLFDTAAGVCRSLRGRPRHGVLPGYTHMQRAQPVLAAHYWLAYCEKLERDRERLADCRRRVNVLPLGAAALAGTSLPIDRPTSPGAWVFADEPVAPARSCQSPTCNRNCRQQPRRLQRSRFCHRIGVRAGDDRRAFERLGRRVDFVEHGRVQFHRSCRRRFAPAARSCRRRSIPTCWS